MPERTDLLEEDWLSPSAAGALIGVVPRTLARMAERHEIASIKLPSGHRRYRRADVEALAKQAAA